MDSKHLLDPTSPQASYGSGETSITSGPPSSSETCKPTTSQSEFDKIEVLPPKEEPKPVARLTETTTTTTMSSSIEQSHESNDDSDECSNLRYYKIIVVLFSMALMIIRLVLYKIEDYFFEVVILTISAVGCCIVTCIFKRGRFAKKWEDLSPKFQSKPRSNYPDTKADSPVAGRVHDSFPMEPGVSREQPRELTYQADVHRGADVETSIEASGSIPVSKSDSGSDKCLASPAPDDSKTSQEGKDVSSPTTSQEESKTDSQEDKKNTSSPALRAFRNLFKRQ